MARLLHWSIALLLVVLFALGWWTTEMDYYDPLYRVVPNLHRSLGILALLLILVRLGWALYDTRPAAVASMPRWQALAARFTHWLLYAAMLGLPVSGYLLSTADGRGVEVFGLFEIPALLPAASGREEIAGTIHYLLGFGGAWLVLLHAAAALKHHFIDRDDTLLKMIGKPKGD
ncbi:cytochrome b [Alkalilimnicola sp. S0819]|nr:cytochrome b/b6 domain-containing protein [Alkalilimnicola sp. S0819]